MDSDINHTYIYVYATLKIFIPIFTQRPKNLAPLRVFAVAILLFISYNSFFFVASVVTKYN